MTPKTCCQRAICGAKNFFKAPMYLKWWNYFLATVEDESYSKSCGLDRRHLKSEGCMQNDLVKFFNKIEIGTLLSDHHLCIEYANPMLCKLLNMSEDQLIGKKVCDILPLSERALNGNSSMTMEMEIGSCTLLKVFIVKETLDEEYRYLFLCADNTFCNKLHEDICNLKRELQISEAIYDNIYDGICITDEKGRTVYVNQAFEELSGVKREEIMGLSGYDMMERNFQTNSCAEIVLKTGEQICVIIKYYKGKRCLATGSPI